jgi:hypothetical protein
VTKAIVAVLVVLLAFGGWKLAHRASKSAEGTVSTLAIAIPDQAALTVAEGNLTQAASAATAFEAANGSFVGLTVPGAAVRSSSATAYCLEETVHGTTAHLAGPNGTPAAGPCPA